jgi:hypothetical protein
MAEWRARLMGNPGELEDAARVLTFSDAHVIEEDGDYFLTSPKFVSLANHSDVLIHAKELLRIINGATRVETGAPLRIEVTDQTVYIGDDGSRQNSASATAGILIVRSWEFDEAKAVEVSKRIRHMLELSAKDTAVADALRFFNAGEPRWDGLYKVFEVIRADVGGMEDLKNTNWVEDRELRNFTHTAQHPAVLGDTARHVRSRAKPPPNPMGLPEAEALIRRLLERWMESKLEGT